MSSLQQKPLWIFLRGLAREQGHWAGFTQRFAQELNCDVLPLDLPGYGKLRFEPSPLSIGKIVDRISSEVPTPNERKVSIFAVSLGGMVATEWITRSPEMFHSAVLVNSSFSVYSRFYERLQLEALFRFAQIISAGVDSDIPTLLRREERVLAMVSNRPELYSRIARDWAEIAERHPTSATNFVRQLWAALRFQPPKTAPKVPTLILTSAKDRMVSPSCSQAIAAAWHAPLRMHSSAGHDLTLDEPEWVLDQVRKVYPPQSEKIN